MILTNKNDLPQSIVDAVKNDEYSSGDADISITGLLRPPKISVLEREHEKDLTEDVSDRIWALMGQSIHTILERANKTGIAERRLSMEVSGWKVSGGMDLFDERGILSDYKLTSVWKVIKGMDDEWEKQLNLYSVLLRAHGHKVEKLQIVAILRDWSKMEAMRDPLYPQAQVVNIEIPLWPENLASQFMKERVILHQQASLTNLPECSPKDRWERPNVYAVMKEGRKSAVKLYERSYDAEQHAKLDRTLKVVLRPGVSMRCQSYCGVSRFCSQYQTSLKQGE